VSRTNFDGYDDISVITWEYNKKDKKEEKVEEERDAEQVEEKAEEERDAEKVEEKAEEKMEEERSAEKI
jgi:hypothetical protein